MEKSVSDRMGNGQYQEVLGDDRRVKRAEKLVFGFVSKRSVAWHVYADEVERRIDSFSRCLELLNRPSVVEQRHGLSASPFTHQEYIALGLDESRVIAVLNVIVDDHFR